MTNIPYFKKSREAIRDEKEAENAGRGDDPPAWEETRPDSKGSGCRRTRKGHGSFGLVPGAGNPAWGDDRGDAKGRLRVCCASGDVL